MAEQEWTVSLEELRELEQRFWRAESKWAKEGSGMTKEQQTGASMAFTWLATKGLAPFRAALAQRDREETT